MQNNDLDDVIDEQVNRLPPLNKNKAVKKGVRNSQQEVSRGRKNDMVDDNLTNLDNDGVS